MRDRVRLNRVRVVVRAQDREGVTVSSTFDKSVKLGRREDADFSWPDTDFIVIQNRRAAPAKITLKNYEPSHDATRLIIQPSRQVTRTLTPQTARGFITRMLARGLVECEVTLGPDENCIVRSDAWLAKDRQAIRRAQTVAGF